MAGRFQSVVNPSLGRYYVLVAQGGSEVTSNVLVYNYNDGFITLWNKPGLLLWALLWKASS
jgi:hypothetical protein